MGPYIHAERRLCSSSARSGFDPALQQTLLLEMKSLKLTIKYVVEDQGENLRTDKYIREVYKITSDGQRFVIQQEAEWNNDVEES